VDLALIRDGLPSDVNFVVNSWVSAHASFTRADGSVVRYVGHPRVVLDLVQRCSVAVACDPEDADQIYGWIAYERDELGSLIVHYTFTKFAFRSSGIAHQLWRHVNPDNRPVVCTHAGFVLPLVRDRYQVTFDPFVLRDPR